VPNDDVFVDKLREAAALQTSRFGSAVFKGGFTLDARGPPPSFDGPGTRLSEIQYTTHDVFERDGALPIVKGLRLWKDVKQLENQVKAFFGNRSANDKKSNAPSSGYCDGTTIYLVPVKAVHTSGAGYFQHLALLKQQAKVKAPKRPAKPECEYPGCRTLPRQGSFCALHKKKPDRPCPQCDASFTKASSLTTHIRTVHEKRRDHACPHCAAAFGEAGSLTAHIRTVHEKRRDHACPHCAAAFGKAGDLTRHVRTVHEKRRDHACPHCAAAFGTAGDMTKHVRTVHEKRRDHACPHCAAAFGKAVDLTRHVRTVHEKRKDHASIL
jgi:uncharacterized C2H2 Zn-finger protein